MKRSIFLIILVIEAVLCIVLNIMKAAFPGGLPAVMAFPFEQIGLLLRSLSLSGGMGNAAAIIVYTAVSLIPAAILLVLMKKKQKLFFEDVLLILLSVVLFVVLYLMINPGIIGSFFGKAMGLAASKAILGSTVYSIISGYLVLKILRLFFDSDTAKLQKYMSVLLCLLNVFFIYISFGFYFSTFLNSIASLRSGNTGNEHLLGVTYAFLALRYAVDALPYIFDALIVFSALQLLGEIRANRYSNESVAAAASLSRLCGIALSATVLTNAAYNVLQLIFTRKLMVINNSVQIPFLSIVFVIAALLFARYIAEDKKLKDENDMFI